MDTTAPKVPPLLSPEIGYNMVDFSVGNMFNHGDGAVEGNPAREGEPSHPGLASTNEGQILTVDLEVAHQPEGVPARDEPLGSEGSTCRRSG
jgi:hypothetical protein